MLYLIVFVRKVNLCVLVTFLCMCEYMCAIPSRWQDVVVGAPQFFQRDGEVGGAVYVYINKAGRWNAVVPTRLNGSKDSMFGLAVKSIGDINLDSYEGRKHCALIFLVKYSTKLQFQY